jgi:predicted secreted protein
MILGRHLGFLNWILRRGVLLLALAVVSGCGAMGSPPPPTEPAVVTQRLEEPTAPPTEEPTSEPTSSGPRPTATPTRVPAPTVRYLLAFEATWSAETHPLDFPPNPHFSGLIGAVHTDAARIWEEGETASPGIRVMAETGEKSPLDAEIEALIAEGSACELISGDGIGLSPGVVWLELTVTQECPLVTVVSMIAPSPDWFVGVSGLNLFNDGQWTEVAIAELAAYDAGTDSGASYTSLDEPTDPPVPVYRIEGEGPLAVDDQIPPLGMFSFTLLDLGVERINESHNGQLIELDLGETLEVRLESNPSTGYSWEIEELDEAVLRQEGDVEYESSVAENPPPGTGGWETFTFVASGTGETELRLVHHRPWEDVEPLAVYTVQVEVR